MRILYVTLDPFEANSSAMMRNKGVIRGLMNNGHEVEVLSIASQNNYGSNERDEFQNIKISRLKSFNVYNSIVKNSDEKKIKRLVGRIMRTIYKSFFLYNHTYFPAKKSNISDLNHKEYDIVISSSDPKTSHIVVKKLKKDGLIIKRWIQYWGDPMSNDITNNVIWPKFVIKIFEGRLLRDAESIIYVSPFTTEIQKKEFKKYSRKMHFIPVPYTKDKVSVEYMEKNNEKFTISYLGSYHSDIRDITPLYEGVSNMSEEFNLHIAGATDLNLQNKKNIKIMPNMNSRDLEEYEEASDLIVCILNSKGTQIPGKVYHYAGTNKLILVIIDGEHGHKIKSYLEKFNRYIFAENNIESIQNAVLYARGLGLFEPTLMLSPDNIALKIIKGEDFELL